MQQTILQQPDARRFLPAFEPVFNIFITCEDQAALAQAKRMVEQVQKLGGNKIVIAQTCWNFALLRDDQLLKCAVIEAAEAEMIVISLSADAELPSHMKCFVESLPVRPQADQAALVALIGSMAQMGVKSQPYIGYFRQIAESRGLSFFCNQSGMERPGFCQPGVRPHVWPARNITSNQASWNSWGINE